MRNRIGGLAIFLDGGALVFASPALAQVYYSGGRSDEQKKAAEDSKATLKYDPHDLSGIWRGVGLGGGPRPGSKDPIVGDAAQSALLGGAPPPPMTPWGKANFDARKPSAVEAWQSRRVSPAVGNDPLGHCDPLGYPRILGGGPVEFWQTPNKLLQVFNGVGVGMSMREIYLDGRKIPDDLDVRWNGWATGHWEGDDTLVVDSTGYDERGWLDGNGWPHSEDMKVHEVYHHPDAQTLEITMTIDDPKAHPLPWVGNKETFKLALPKASSRPSMRNTASLRKKRNSTKECGIRRAAMWSIHGR